MFFFKNKKISDANVAAKKGVKKVDALVTGMILSGVVASIYGVKKIRENNASKEKEEEKNHTHMIENIETASKKRSILKRILFGNK